MAPKKIILFYVTEGAIEAKKDLLEMFGDPEEKRIIFKPSNPAFAKIQLDSDNRADLLVFLADVPPTLVARIAAMWLYPVYKIRVVGKQPFRRNKKKSLINEQVDDLKQWNPEKFLKRIEYAK